MECDRLQYMSLKKVVYEANINETVYWGGASTLEDFKMCHAKVRNYAFYI